MRESLLVTLAGVMDIAELATLLEGLDVDLIDSSHPSFLEAAETARKVQGLDNDTQLQLYGLYKQSTLGDIKTSKPSFIDVVGRAKWVAWKEFEGFPMDAAARAYVYLVSHMLPKTNHGAGATTTTTSSTGSGNGSGSGGGVSSEGVGGSIFDGMGVTMSSLAAADMRAASGQAWREGEALFKAVVEGDEEAVRLLLETEGCVVNARDASLMTPLHFAADRGYAPIVKLLLQHGADPTARDQDDQLPITIAGVCEHEDVVRILLEHSACP